jgi:hypothetical protein
MTDVKKKPNGRYYQTLPIEGKKTVDNFANYIDLYFKDQKAAGDALLVKQSTISRYMSGQSPIPQEVASRLVEHLGSKIELHEIHFDYKKYLASLVKKTA